MLPLTNGTVSVADGDTTVTGVGTTFGQVKAGSKIYFHETALNTSPIGQAYWVTEITSDLSLEIYPPHQGGAAGVKYVLEPNFYEIDFAVQIDALLSAYGEVISATGPDRTLTLDKTALGDDAGVILRTNAVDMAAFGTFGSNEVALQGRNDVALANLLKTEGLGTAALLIASRVPHLLKSGIGFAGPIEPAQLAADVDDWAVPLIGTNVVKVKADLNNGLGHKIKGIAGGYEGRVLVIENVGITGNGPVILAAEQTSSVAANRFAGSVDYPIQIGESVAIIKDESATSGGPRWRIVGASSYIAKAAALRLAPQFS